MLKPYISQCLTTQHSGLQPGLDWEISLSSRPYTTVLEPWTTLFLYGHHIKKKVNILRLGPCKIIKGSLLKCTITSIFLFFLFISPDIFLSLPCVYFFVTSSPAGVTVINRTVSTLLQNNHHCV